MAKRVIKLMGEPIQDEDNKAGEAITPGHLITLNGSGNWIKHNVGAGPVVPVRVAAEREEWGDNIDVAYATNDTVKAYAFKSGERALLLVAAAAPAIAKDDLLESAGDGTVRKATTGTELDIVGRALEALDNSAGGSAARLRVVIR